MLTIILATFVVAPLVAFVAFLWSQGVLRLKSKREKYPPYLLSEKNNGEIAGWIETITGLTGPRAPHFVYEGMKKLPKGHPWIIQGNFPNRSASGYAYAVADIHLAKQILMSPQSTKSVMYKDVDNLTCGFQNIFTSNGHRWKHARKQVAPAFSSNHIKRMVRICEEQLSILLKERIDVWAKEGKAFDLGKEMVCLTLSIISEAAFEYPMSREEMKLFTDNLETAAECFVIMNPLHQAFP